MRYGYVLGLRPGLPSARYYQTSHATTPVLDEATVFDTWEEACKARADGLNDLWQRTGQVVHVTVSNTPRVNIISED